jgi:hypothetical protein
LAALRQQTEVVYRQSRHIIDASPVATPTPEPFGGNWQPRRRRFSPQKSPDVICHLQNALVSKVG